MDRRIPHVGPRMVKTAIAVALALFLANLRGTQTPIFAAIGAISAVTRTVGDTLHSCMEQFAGLLIGTAFGYVCVSLFGGWFYLAVAVGMLALIFVCVLCRLQFAVPLSCIVFVSICLAPASEAIPSSLNRLIDTAIGLGIGFAVNVLIRPYNNRAKISALFSDFLREIPGLLDQRVLRGSYPPLDAMRERLQTIGSELSIFEKQRLLLRAKRGEQQQQCVYLRGCEQLAQSVMDELSALCTMDENGALDAQNATHLRLLGLSVPEEPARKKPREADTVMNYHLHNLLLAYQYLSDFNTME